MSIPYYIHTTETTFYRIKTPLGYVAWANFAQLPPWQEPPSYLGTYEFELQPGELPWAPPAPGGKRSIPLAISPLPHMAMSFAAKNDAVFARVSAATDGSARWVRVKHTAKQSRKSKMAAAQMAASDAAVPAAEVGGEVGGEE